METFKDRMRRIRKRAGFTSQGKAAAAIGCERGTVSMWEAPSSNVRSVGSEWLFDVARAYQVRPEWINNLRDKDDGYPWSELNPSGPQTPANRVAEPRGESQFAGPDPAILHEAVMLLVFDIDHGGPRTARSASDLLLDLYRRIEAAGGKLPPGEGLAFEEAARSRGTGDRDGDIQRDRKRGKR